MRKRSAVWVCAIAATCGVAGLLVGVGIGYNAKMKKDVFALNTMESVNFDTTASRLSRQAFVLSKFRAGDTETALTFLENGLDADILTLSHYETLVPEDFRDDSVYSALAEAAEYRATYPRHLDGTVSPDYLMNIDAALALANHKAPTPHAP